MVVVELSISRDCRQLAVLMYVRLTEGYDVRDVCRG